VSPKLNIIEGSLQYRSSTPLRFNNHLLKVAFNTRLRRALKNKPHDYLLLNHVVVWF